MGVLRLGLRELRGFKGCCAERLWGLTVFGLRVWVSGCRGLRGAGLKGAGFRI